MNMPTPKNILVGSALLLIVYMMVLLVWLQIKDHYHLFLIHQIVERIIGLYDFKIIDTKWLSDNYFAKILFKEFIEIVPKQSAIEYTKVFAFNLGSISAFSTFATPISLTIVLLYALLKRTKQSFKVLLEVMLLLFITHIVIFVLMTLLRIDVYYGQVISKLSEAGFRDAISKPLAPWLFDTLYYLCGFLIKIVVRIEPLLIALYIFLKNKGGVKF